MPEPLRDDVYRRPLLTALERLGIGPGWRCVDVGAGGGDVSVALAAIVGRAGRGYAGDSDPRARGQHAGGGGLVVARARRPRLLPFPAHARARSGGGALPHATGRASRRVPRGPG